jgi:hypothetical protein
MSHVCHICRVKPHPPSPTHSWYWPDRLKDQGRYVFLLIIIVGCVCIYWLPAYVWELKPTCVDVPFVFLQSVFALEPLPTALSLTDEPGVSSTRLLVLVITTRTGNTDKSLTHTHTHTQELIQQLRQIAAPVCMLCYYVGLCSSYVGLPGLWAEGDVAEGTLVVASGGVCWMTQGLSTVQNTEGKIKEV